MLVQDYHFALLPRMIRERLPKATIITFWHIPWPNPEAFAICPWRVELLDGLLGSDILGFHTQFHCNNFLDMRRPLRRGAHRPRDVHRRLPRQPHGGAPLSDLDRVAAGAARQRAVAIDEARERVRVRFNLPRGHKVGVGIDRLDYTKGIVERFNAVARLLELQPEWVGQLHVRADRRAVARHHRRLPGLRRARAQARRARSTRCIPARRTRRSSCSPSTTSPTPCTSTCAAADVCFVSSLHDGMNLVAKEFVAARDDERGVLMLSQFAGASRELPEALIVNPYDAEQCASALDVALTMSAEEQRDRMRLMRNIIREFNVYRWAGRMLLDAAAMRQRKRFGAQVEAPTA